MKVADGDNWGPYSSRWEERLTPLLRLVLVHMCGDPVEANNIPGRYDQLLSQGWDNNTFYELRGGMNGWGEGDVFRKTSRSKSYTLRKLQQLPGSQHGGKFKANPDENFNNGGWETGERGVFEFTGEDLVLAAEHLNSSNW